MKSYLNSQLKSTWKNLKIMILLGVWLIITLLISCNKSPDVSKKDPDLSKGLMVYYPFNGNAVDFSGNSNNAQIIGATLTSDRSENPNSAFYFNGNRQKITSTYPINITDKQPRTISFWFSWELNPYSNGGKQKVLGWGECDDIGKYNFICINQDSVRDYNDMQKGKTNEDIGTIIFNGHNIDLNSQFELAPIEKWNLLLFTYDGFVGKLYLNNKIVAEDSLKLETSASLLDIGYTVGCINHADTNSGWNTSFNGKIDEIRIYNRVLSDEEIKILYQF
jgi:hypothetical protein